LKIQSGTFGERAQGESIEFAGDRLEILADDGGALYQIHMDGTDLYIDTGGYRIHQGVHTDTGISISPRGHGQIVMRREFVNHAKEPL